MLYTFAGVSGSCACQLSIVMLQVCPNSYRSLSLLWCFFVNVILLDSDICTIWYFSLQSGVSYDSLCCVRPLLLQARGKMKLSLMKSRASWKAHQCDCGCEKQLQKSNVSGNICYSVITRLLPCHSPIPVLTICASSVMQGTLPLWGSPLFSTLSHSPWPETYKLN